MASTGNISPIITIRHIFFPRLPGLQKKTIPRAAKKTHTAVMAGAVEAPMMKISYLGYLFGKKLFSFALYSTRYRLGGYPNGIMGIRPCF